MPAAAAAPGAAQVQATHSPTSLSIQVSGAGSCRWNQKALTTTSNGLRTKWTSPTGPAADAGRCWKQPASDSSGAPADVQGACVQRGQRRRVSLRRRLGQCMQRAAHSRVSF